MNIPDQPSCILCNGSENKFLYKPKASLGPVVRCSSCSLVYVKTQNFSPSIIVDGPALPNRQSETLPLSVEDILQHSREGFHLKNKQAEYPAALINHVDALARVERFQKPPGRLLDFGCGGGFFLNTAKQRGWQIVGLEPRYGHAAYAHGRFGAQIVNDTLHPDTFETSSFDVITAFQVFEHLVNPGKVLSNLTHFLKPGGILLIEVPNIDTWSVRLLGKRHRHFVHDHLYFFSPRTLRLLLEQAGLQPVEVYFPARRMTVRHLVEDWGRRFLSARLQQRLAQVVRRAGWSDKIITLNFGDIVAILGKKPA